MKHSRKNARKDVATGNRGPNFLVIGAHKSGTTACYHHLKSHPDIFMSPVKEPRFFGVDGTHPRYGGPGVGAHLPGTTYVADEGEYLQLFSGSARKKAVGEASTIYLYLPGCAGRISQSLPNVRLIAILRNPIERAFSNFLHAKRDSLEPLETFAAALDAEEARIRDNWPPFWHYANRGFYGIQLPRYVELFGHDQLRIYLYEDFVERPADVIGDMYAFLGVDRDFRPDLTKRFNESGLPRSARLFSALTLPGRSGLIPRALASSNLWQRVRAALNRTALLKPPIPMRDRARLQELYRTDIGRLESLLNRDLSHWLRHPSADAAH